MDKKRKRTDLSFEQKREVCAYKGRNPKATHEEIACHFNREWKTDISRRTVSDILSQKGKWSVEVGDSLGPRTKAKRLRHCKNEDMEKALYLWFTQMRGRHVVITDAILTEKARYFGNQMAVENFTYSSGWLTRFKARYSISMKAVCGESEGVDPVTVAVGRYEAAEQITEYDLNDVYNCDESALFFRMPPGKTLSTGPTHGTKRYKDRVTLMFCCNATGTDKRKVLMIGKAAQPRCFKNFNVQLHVDYVHSRKGWMNSSLFFDFVTKLNADMRRQERKILLLLDNASSHPSDVELSNVTLSFLPPNTTSHLQPLDSGIIKCFKSHYRKLQLQHIVQMIEDETQPDLNLKQAVYFVKAAWQNVSPAVVQNCWVHAGLITKDSLLKNSVTEEPVASSVPTSDVQAILGKLPGAGSLMSASEYINVDAAEATEQEMTDDEIVQAVLCEAEDSELEARDEEEEEPDIPPPSLREARQAMTVLLRYFESNNNTTVEEMDKILSVEKLVKEKTLKNLCQTKITGYFSAP